MLNVCQACTCRFAVDLKTCPQCGSTDFVHESLLEEAAAEPSTFGALDTAHEYADEVPRPDPAPASEDGAGEQQG